jgi:predicted Zn-dependent peptidase
LIEIYREVDLIQNKLVEEEELEMVKNYLLGNFLSMLDGPFNVSEVVKTIVTERLDFPFFNKLVKTVQDITAEDLQKLAQKYLNTEDMWEVVVGS